MESSSSTSLITFSIENFPCSPGVINVYGKKGSGKSSYFLQMKHVKFDHEILKSKEKTCDFMEMMKCATFPLVLDDYELLETYPGTKEVISLGKCLKVPFYIVTTEKLDSCPSNYQFPGVPLEVFEKAFLSKSSLLSELIEKYDGNMTAVRLDLENFKSERDVFLSSKEYVSEIIQIPKRKLPWYIDRHLTEHGNTLGIIHENYVDFSPDMELVTQSLSDADVIDMKIYSDVSWDLMNYFNVSACLVPALYMNKGEPLDNFQELDLRPGSIWTKNSNMLMKRNRLKRLRIQDRDEIQLWVLKANSGEYVDKRFDSYDLDSINQLAFTKIKSRVLTTLKKKCPKKDAN